MASVPAHFEVLLAGLLAVAACVALLVRWLRIPYTVGLVLAGLALGSLSLLHPPRLTKDLLLTVFLPGLLFEAAFHLKFSSFWANKIVIVAMAIPGVLASLALTAGLLTPAAHVLRFADGFTWTHALVFAGIIVTTDPIAVVSAFKSLGVPNRLAVLVEGESLLNDGTAVVVFGLLVDVAGGAPMSAGLAVGAFARVVGVGCLAGAAVGYAASLAIRRVDEPMIEITITTVAAYGSFAVAEGLHGSGVIATVIAGMLCGSFGAPTGMSPSTRLAVDSFWEYLAFVLNSMVFLLIGFEVRPRALIDAWLPIVVAFVAVIVARAVVVNIVALLLRRSPERLPRGWAAVLTWGGLRGGLSMVLALSLAPDFPHRQLLEAMTFGVVLLSILGQGLSMSWVIRRLGLARARLGGKNYEIGRARVLVARAALESLDTLERATAAPADLVRAFRAEYEARVEAARRDVQAAQNEHPELGATTARAMRRSLVMAERDALVQAHRRSMLAHDTFDELNAELARQLLELD